MTLELQAEALLLCPGSHGLTLPPSTSFWLKLAHTGSYTHIQRVLTKTDLLRNELLTTSDFISTSTSVGRHFLKM